jgi:hypothetical protein
MIVIFIFFLEYSKNNTKLFYIIVEFVLLFYYSNIFQIYSTCVS